MTSRIEALSKGIAEFMEPEPTWPEWTAVIGPENYWQVSDGRFWRGSFSSKGDDLKPVSITDPAVSMRLLKELLAMGRVVSALGISDAARRGSFVHHTLAEFEIAIAEDFCRAHRIEVPDD